MSTLSNTLGSLAGIAGEMVPVEELRELQKALRANAVGHLAKADVGYPTQAVAATNDLAALVPQSIQPTLDSATFLQKHIVFWRQLQKVNVTSTLHESNVIREHGNMEMDPFISEGGVGPFSEGTYERKVVRIKYLAEHIEISDVGTMVGITGINRSALAQRTQDGTLAILGKLERSLFMADADLSPLHFDGLYKQIVADAPNNLTDNRGAATSPQQLQEVLGQLVATPNYSYPTVIMVEPQVYQSLVNIASAAGRHDQLRARQGGAGGGNFLTYGHDRLFVGGSMGNVEVVSVPLMNTIKTPNAAAQGGTTAPTITGLTVTPVAQAPTGGNVSQFTAADAGDYIYQVVAVGDGGIAAPITTITVTVAAGQEVEFTLNDDTLGLPIAGDNGIRYYRVFRSDRDAAVGTAKFQWHWPRAAVGTDTIFFDLNRHIPGTSQVYALQLTPDVMHWTQLLDFTRRPLAQVATTVPFLLMLFGALHVKVPTKNWIVDNVALTL